MKRKIKTRRATEAEAAALTIKIEGSNIIIDDISYRIPQHLLGVPTEQIIAFYRGWYRVNA